MTLPIRAMMLMTLATLLFGGAVTQAAPFKAFRMPTDDEIQSIAEDPAKLKDFITHADVEQTVQVLVKVIVRVHSFNTINGDVKRTRVSKMFDVVRATHADTAATIIARVAKRVNPRLLPIIRMGDASTYVGQ
jgi:hypothetical protein